MHDADFRQSERDWHSFVEKLTERLVGIDDTVPELPVKDIVGLTMPFVSEAQECLAHHICPLQVFRIYRDVRFSPDKTPYKVGKETRSGSCRPRPRLEPAHSLTHTT